MAPTERPDIGYAMIFPSATIVKVIAAQVVGLLAFGHFDLGLWIGIFVPRATPRDVVLRLNRALNELLAQPDLSEQVKREGGEITPMAPEQFASFVRSESARYADLLQEEFCSRLLLGGCLGFGFAD